MNDLKQAAQQALEFLRILDYVPKRSPKFNKAITALEDALAAPQPEPVTPQRQPLSDEQLREALRQCPHDTVANLRSRWLDAKDFARAIEAAHGIGGDK